jgi:hypothetical protein
MSNNTPVSTALARVNPEEVPAMLAQIPPKSSPTAIVRYILENPFNPDVSIDLASLPVGAVTRKKTSVGERVEVDLADAGGAVVLNKLTPEMLLACVVGIIATSADAATACARIRAEVEGWKFQAADGTVK